jgi:hypothetical protein
VSLNDAKRVQFGILSLPSVISKFSTQLVTSLIT